MSWHLVGAVVTGRGIAANNRGETEGNVTTLQKVLWNGDVHTTVSAEAIRWAIRSAWQQRGLAVNRQWDELTRRHSWNDPEFVDGAADYIDDDVLGYMSAQAAKVEAGDDSESGSGRGRGRARGGALVRRSRFEVTRAVSLDPWPGDVVFSVASIGATPSAAMKGAFPVPYSAEVHATRYQYGFALTPESLIDRHRALDVVDAVIDLGDVAGNHARFYFDFAPDAVIFRWTEDFAPRILCAFVGAADGELSVPRILERVGAGDIDPAELIVGGSLAGTADGEALRELGATVTPGVKRAAEEVKRRLSVVMEG
jgi:CRISPR-associated protein Cst2